MQKYPGIGRRKARDEDGPEKGHLSIQVIALFANSNQSVLC